MAKQKSSYYYRAFAYGALGAFTMTILLVLMRWVGLTQFNLSVFLGSMLTGNISTSSWAMGFSWHILNGGIFGLVYAGLFKWTGSASAGKGTSFAFVHWLFFSVFMGVASSFHALIPAQIADPGYFALNYGVLTAITGLVLHLVFGFIVGNALEGSVFHGRKSSARIRPRQA